MGKKAVIRPDTPKPEGSTHYDSLHWYKADGWFVWLGGEWVRCHWGDLTATDHLVYCKDIPTV